MPGGANTWQMEARDTSASTYCLSHPKCLFWAKPGYSRVSPQPLLRKRRPPPDGFVVFYFPPQDEKGKTKKRNGEEKRKEKKKRKREREGREEKEEGRSDVTEWIRGQSGSYRLQTGLLPANVTCTALLHSYPPRCSNRSPLTASRSANGVADQLSRRRD